MAKKKIKNPYRKYGGFQKARHVFPAGHPQPAQPGKQLAPAAVAVTIRFAAGDGRDEQRNEKTQKPQPGKQDIEKARDKVQNRYNP